ncbi:MAG: hypothetical protein MHPSP_002232 [Paramarteilia canceri]
MSSFSTILGNKMDLKPNKEPQTFCSIKKIREVLSYFELDITFYALCFLIYVLSILDLLQILFLTSVSDEDDSLAKALIVSEISFEVLVLPVGFLVIECLFMCVGKCYCTEENSSLSYNRIIQIVKSFFLMIIFLILLTVQISIKGIVISAETKEHQENNALILTVSSIKVLFLIVVVFFRGCSIFIAISEFCVEKCEKTDRNISLEESKYLDGESDLQEKNNKKGQEKVLNKNKEMIKDEQMKKMKSSQNRKRSGKSKSERVAKKKSRNNSESFLF